MKSAADGRLGADSPLRATCLDGIFLWRTRASGDVLDRTAFYIRGDERLLIDPIMAGSGDLDALGAQGAPDWVVVTSAETSVQSLAIAKAFGARVAAGALDAFAGVAPDRELHDGDRIGPAQVVAIAGAQPGEIALHVPEARAVLGGAIVIGDPVGSIRMPNDDSLTNPRQAVLSLRRLWSLQPQHLLVTRGDCVFGNASARIGDCLQSRADVYVNRINVDELEWREPKEPGRYQASIAEIGYHIGARSLGYRLVRLPPGKTFCPLHWHEEDEELFFIMDGEATLRTPRGDFTVRRGDFIAFPTGPVGAHNIRNDGSRECTVMMLSDNSDGDDVCHYPDSNKVLLSESGLILRKEPDLDYYDGEPA